MIFRYLITVFCFICISACTSLEEKQLETALEFAGDNRAELEKVITYYREQGDKEKEEAARFLIRNMLGKYYKAGEPIDQFNQYLDSTYQIVLEAYDSQTINEDLLKIVASGKGVKDTKADLKQLDAAFLISHIDRAFQVRNKPWNKHLSFDDFCEWILPYRLGNELPEQWRDEYAAVFSPLLTDSILTAREACVVINQELMKLPINVFNDFAKLSDIKPSALLHIKFGLCEDYTHQAVYAMRSVGIPVTIAVIPHWGRGNNNHSFNLVYDNDGKCYDFSGSEENPEEHLKRFEGIPKIYQRTFSLQRNTPVMMDIPAEDIPPFFRNSYLKDVTGDFSFIRPQTISVPLNKGNYEKVEYAYLCVFDPKGWFAVDWGKVSHGQVTFRDVGPDIIYQVASYKQNTLEPLSVPFCVDSTGNIRTYECNSRKIDMALERKYREPKHLALLPPLIVGGKFQGSDFPDFRRAEDLYVFTEVPDFKYTTVEVNPKKAYKYYRYLASDKTHGNMAELEFYDAVKGEILKGTVLGTDETSVYFPRATKHKVFDGDPLTFFHTRDTLSWAGLALAQPTRIDRIRYIIRNDDNGIRRGNHYELFYIDETGHWASAGKKIAEQDDLLIYEQVPEGTLYWLRNYTRGREERIFTYEAGKPVWW